MTIEGHDQPSATPSRTASRGRLRSSLLASPSSPRGPQELPEQTHECTSHRCEPTRRSDSTARSTAALKCPTPCSPRKTSGVASIAQGTLATYGAFFREYFAIPENRRLVCGISLGYDDREHPAISFRRRRAPHSGVVSWIDGVARPSPYVPSELCPWARWISRSVPVADSPHRLDRSSVLAELLA
jgi:hypothetical protein